MAFALAAALATTASAQEAKPADAKPAEAAKPAEPPKASPFKFEFHGFIGASISGSDAQLNGSGVGAYYVAGTPNEHRYSLWGDARQTRLNFSIAGPKVLGAQPKGVAEIDIAGASQVTGGTFGNANLTPRLRLAYAELNWGGKHILRIGQDTDLNNGAIAPASVGHIQTNLAYSAGYLGGERHVGLFYYETIPLTPDYKVELALQVSRGQWDDNQADANQSSGVGDASSSTTCTTSGTTTTCTTTSSTANASFAESSGLPMIQGRARFISKYLEAFAAGAWTAVHFQGIDNRSNPGAKDRDVVAGNGGIKANYAGVTLQGSGYVGKNVGAFNGAAINQRQAANRGDIHSWGLWGQLGYNITPEFSVWGLVGTEKLQPREVRDAGLTRWRNLVYSGMLRYQENGYAIGLEYAHWATSYLTVPSAVSARRSPDAVLHGNQLMLSGFYFF